MIHFIYLVIFAVLIGVVFGAIASGTTRDRLIYGLKTFLQFLGVSLLIAWIIYFIPW